MLTLLLIPLLLLLLLLCPGAGKVLRWQVPATAVPFDHNASIRVDSGVSEGDTVGTNYGKQAHNKAKTIIKR